MCQNTIIPKPCVYNCGTRIYWNIQENAYDEVFTKKKHNCPNRSKSNNNVTQSTTTKPKYYYNISKSLLTLNQRCLIP